MVAPAPPASAEEDTTPPLLTRSYNLSWRWHYILFVFTESLDPDSIPATTDFRIEHDGVALPVTAVEHLVSYLLLRWPPQEERARTVKVVYTPGEKRIQDLAGNQTPGFTWVWSPAPPPSPPPSRPAGDRTPPEFTSAVVNGDRLTVTFDEVLDGASRPPGSAFTVTGTAANGAVRTIAGSGTVALSETVATVTLDGEVRPGETVTVSYRRPAAGAGPLRDRSGNAVAAFAGKAVVNVTGDGTPPRFVRADVDGTGLTVTFDEQLDPASVPAAHAFFVTREDGSRIGGQAITLAGRTATVTLAQALQAGETATMSYRKPATNPLRDIAGNEVASYSVRAVAGAWIGCKQRGAALQVASAGSGGGRANHHFALTLELEEHRDGTARPVELGCVAIAAPERRFTYAIAAGDASRFSVGAADGSLRYVGSGEHAARTPEYALTVTAAPDDGGAALRVAVRVVIVTTGGQAVRRAPMVEFGLAGFGRAAAADAVQVIGRRFALMRRAAADLDTPHPTVTVHGRSLDLAGVRAQASGEPVRGAAEAPGHRVQPHGEAVRQAPSGAQLLAGSAFNAGGGARWAAWGSGNLSRFGGTAGGVRQDGTVLSGYLGADYRFAPNAVAGLAGSYATLDLASTTDLDDDATLQGRLVHVYPYAWWMPEEWLGIWGLAGFGIGTAEFSDGAGSLQGDLRSWLGAAGQRTELWSGGGVSLAATADGFVTGVASAGELPAVRAHAWRARLMVETGVDARLADARLSGLFNLGTRLDGGDAGQGLGAEASAEIGVTHLGTGLGLTGRGRLLLAHENRDLRDWGASATLSWQPPDHGPGLAVSLAPYAEVGFERAFQVDLHGTLEY